MSDSITHSPPACQYCGAPTNWTESTLSADKMQVVHSFRCSKCENQMTASEPVQSDPKREDFGLCTKRAH